MAATLHAMINKMLEPLSNRIRMMAARFTLQSVNDTKKMQLVQITLLAGEVRDNIERFQMYGFTSNPFAGAEGLGLFLGGNRECGVTFCIDDRRYRLTGMQTGEVALYDDQGNIIKLARNGQINITAIAKIVVTAPEVDINASTKCVITSPEIDLTASTKLVITAADTTVSGALEVAGTLTASGGIVGAGGGAANINAITPQSGKLALTGELDVTGGPIKVNGTAVTVP